MSLTDSLLRKLGNGAKDFLRRRTGVEVEITEYGMTDRWRKMVDKTFLGTYAVSTGKRAQTILGAQVNFSLLEMQTEEDDGDPMELILGSYQAAGEQPNAKYPLHLTAHKSRDFEFEIHNLIDFELGPEKVFDIICRERLQSGGAGKVLGTIAGLKQKEFCTCLKVTLDVKGAWVKPYTVFPIEFNESPD